MVTRGRRRCQWRYATSSSAVAIVLLLWASLALGLSGWPGEGEPASACVNETDALAGMPQGSVLLADQRELNVRIAATAEQRAAGMQHLCPDAIAENPILFVFESPTRPHFHMNNVRGALDIVFIGTRGTIVGIKRMTPGQRHLTTTGEPVIAALEVAAGKAESLGLTEGQHIEWEH